MRPLDCLERSSIDYQVTRRCKARNRKSEREEFISVK